MHLSLVIPAYNEAARLGPTLACAQAYLAQQPYTSEVVVVDDGSTDDTGAVARASGGVRVLRHAPNRGKGYAVRAGLLAAQGEYRCYYDADGSTPITCLDRVWPRFASGADVVIGSRALADSDVAVHQAWYREQMGKTFNRLLRLLALTPFIDTQCGFKVFRANAAEAICARQTIERFSFDVELLYIARLQGWRVQEVPVVWRNDPDTRVHALRDSLRMFLDVLRIRSNAWRGRYR